MTEPDGADYGRDPGPAQTIGAASGILPFKDSLHFGTKCGVAGAIADRRSSASSVGQIVGTGYGAGAKANGKR
jgi:hypothetical protein